MAGKTNRKHGRNDEYCKAYKAAGRREINKQIKLARHRKAHPNDVGNSPAANYTRKKPLDVYEKIFNRNA